MIMITAVIWEVNVFNFLSGQSSNVEHRCDLSATADRPLVHLIIMAALSIILVRKASSEIVKEPGYFI